MPGVLQVPGLRLHVWIILTSTLSIGAIVCYAYRHGNFIDFHEEVCIARDADMMLSATHGATPMSSLVCNESLQENLQGQEWFRQLFQKHSDLWSKVRPLPLSAEATSWWMKHEKSYEFPVLEAAHDFCRAAGGEGRRHAAAYVHTKGSSHPGAGQDQWRHVMNHFVISRYRDCLHHLGCGYATCGALLHGQALMYAGNFWWARCDYLRQLRHPRPSESDFGSAAPDKGRYLAELWVLSGAQGASYHKSCWGTPRPGRPGPSFPVCAYRVPEAARPC